MPFTLPRALSAGLLSASLLLAAGGAPASALDDTQRSEFETLIHDYLVKNPEVIQEAIGELQKRQEAAEATRRKSQIAAMKDDIYTSPHAVVVGNPKGDVTLVEFFDYNCGYCKRSLGDLVDLIKNDPKLRVVLKEFPVLGPGSVEAAQVAVGVRMVAPDKYFAFHQKLLGDRGQANKAKALAAAKDVGVDSDKLEAAIADPEVRVTLEQSMKIADSLGINGTPSYVLGDELIVGAVGHDQLKGAIQAVRNCGKTQC
ncbi:DsbA family protein [Ancylobacter sp. 6x-1]|uniref:DsbA family protein n=1 Tax=Ancylobacter crimeensis TaxID=2579147 RepID=A0ABT0D694_9HYPH|nr:DsbA family protein [Ancylobacter crimeensis]MCK0195470.1 DsbA family protein [Ancylobacter crimeensis]